MTYKFYNLLKEKISQNPWWHFNLTTRTLNINTPFFGFTWSEWDQEVCKATWWRGFTLFWKKNKNATEGDLLYLKSVTFVVEEVDLYHLHRELWAIKQLGEGSSATKTNL